MEYKKKMLVLDNFREVLKSYSLDVQDVVRSAILDGVDISMYLEQCKNAPYRLDQIRLGMKEGLSKTLLSIKSGDQLYKIRCLRNKGKDISLFEEQILKGLAGDGLDLLIAWVGAGYNAAGLNMSIIPMNMVKIFEYGLSKGFDMRYFNNGKEYPVEYVKACLSIVANGKDIKVFTEKDPWDLEVLKLLVGYSKGADTKKWGSLLSIINSNSSADLVKCYIRCVNNGIPTNEIKKPAWTAAAINYIIKGFEEGLDCSKLIGAGPNEDDVKFKYNELSFLKAKEKRLKGVLRKG